VGQGWGGWLPLMSPQRRPCQALPWWRPGATTAAVPSCRPGGGRCRPALAARRQRAPAAAAPMPPLCSSRSRPPWPCCRLATSPLPVSSAPTWPRCCSARPPPPPWRPSPVTGSTAWWRAAMLATSPSTWAQWCPTSPQCHPWRWRPPQRSPWPPPPSLRPSSHWGCCCCWAGDLPAAPSAGGGWQQGPARALLRRRERSCASGGRAPASRLGWRC
jgi:hypothetical protein